MGRNTSRHARAFCLWIIAGMSVILGNLVIFDGKIVNRNDGPLNFDLTDDGNSDITMTSNGMLGIGNASPISTVDLSGSIGFSSELHTASGCISGNTIVFGDTSASDLTLTLPPASTVTGRVYQIKKLSLSNNLVVNAANNIDNGSYFVLTTSTNGFPYLNVYSSGTQWYITSKSE